MTVRQIVEILDSDGLTDVYSILADESPDVAEEVLDNLATPSRFNSLHAEDNISTLIASVLLLYADLRDRKGNNRYRLIQIKGAGYVLGRLGYSSIKSSMSSIIDVLLGIQGIKDFDILDKIFKTSDEVAKFYMRAVSGIIRCFRHTEYVNLTNSEYTQVGSSYHKTQNCLQTYNLFIKYYNERMMEL